MSDARRRLVKPGARVIPSHIRWLALPVSVPVDRRELLRFSHAAAESLGRVVWDRLRPLVAAGERHAGAPFLGQAFASGWPRLSPPIALAEIDLAAGDSLPRVCHGSVAAATDGHIDATLLCWEATLSPDNTLSTVPGVANADSHWRVQLVWLPQPVSVAQGDVITVWLERQRPPRCAVS